MHTISTFLDSAGSKRGAAIAPIAVVGTIAALLTASPADASEPRGATLHAPAHPSLLAAVHTPATAAHPALRAHAAVSHSAAHPSLLASQQVPTTTAAPDTHVVQAGDTVSAIAARYGLRTTDVLALNGLTWRSVILPGQVVRLSGASAPSAPAPASPAATTYTIQGGDTIYAIAGRHGVTAQALLSANGLDRASIIYPGQTLAIPGASTNSAAPTTAAPAPAPAAPAAPATSGAYEVRAGDTVSAIAARNGLGAEAVLAANGLGWSSIIYPGQKLTIPSATLPGLDGEQSANARLIAQIGRELGVSDRGIAIALGTAMQESWLRNLDWGDRDSLGLFQQRPSTGWGTAEQVRDAPRSIRAFYGGSSDPNGNQTRGLLDIPGWQDMAYADAAQAVQISAFPERYARWEAPASAWLAAIG